MKKILSILSILTFFSSSTLLANGGIACSGDKAVDLQKFAIFNINDSISRPGPIPPKPVPPKPTPSPKVVVGPSAYTNVENAIMKQYNYLKNKNELKLDNFVIGDASKLSDTKTFAIQIIDPTTNKALPSDNSLSKPTGNNVLKNNALNVLINTNDKNATTKQAKIPAYLNKFVYTNANLNNGNDIVTTSVAGKKLLAKSNAIDTTKLGLKNVTLSSTTLSNNLIQAICNAANKNASKISKLIIDNFNNQLKNETSFLNGLNLLNVISDTSNILYSKLINLYAKNASKNIVLIPNKTTLPANSEIFAQLSDSFLRTYIAFPNAYCYLYLGSTS